MQKSSASILRERKFDIRSQFYQLHFTLSEKDLSFQDKKKTGFQKDFFWKPVLR